MTTPHKEQLLSHLPEASWAHIHRVGMDSATRVKLLGMGIGIGTHIEVLRNRRGDVIVAAGNNRISLGRSISEHIVVHQEQGE